MFWGNGHTPLVAEAFRRGVHDYIARPFTLEAIKCSMARALEQGRISMAQQPTHHNKAGTTTGHDPLPVTQRPVPSLGQTKSSRYLSRLGRTHSIQIRRLVRQCRQWLTAHKRSCQQAHSGSVGPPPPWWAALELRNESEHRRIRRVYCRSAEGSGPIVIPEIIEREVLRREVPW
jgi:hypothetical protein